MAGRIPKQFIQDLVLRVNIVELIETRIKLKKRGKNYQACCPFHQEKTPSFSVSEDKQFYHCFGCQANGNAIGFLIAYDQLNFVEAVEALAQFAGVPVPYEESLHQEKNALKETDYEFMQQIADYFQSQLKQSDQAIQYLKNRGLSGQIAKQFNIGFAPAGWDNLLNKFGSNEEKIQQLNRLGMIVPRENGGYYDRFRHRIVFPIKDRQGRIIAFGGRVIGDDLPKYLNSPETPIYHKSDILYGFYESKIQNRKLSRLILVEGYLDVITLHQYGINYAVAALGTAATASHIATLLRATSELVFCFDGDNAGFKAAKRSLETLLPILPDDKYVKFLFLEKGSDPDSFIRQHGSQAMLQKIEQAMPLPDYFLQSMTNDIPSFDLQGQIHVAKRASDYFNQMPNTLIKSMLEEKLADHLHIDINKLHYFMSNKPDSKPNSAVKLRKRSLTPLAQSIALLIQYPQLLKDQKCLDNIPKIQAKDIRLLYDICEIIQSLNKMNTGLLLEALREHSNYNAYVKLAQETFMLESDDSIVAEFKACILRLAALTREQQIDELMKKAKSQTITDDERKTLQALLIMKD